jgi:hypothetical protein
MGRAFWGGGSTQIVAQAIATDPTATESPLGTGVVTVQLSAAAGAGGLSVAFSVSGTAQASEYALSGPGVSFNSASANRYESSFLRDRPSPRSPLRQSMMVSLKLLNPQ